MKAKAAAVEPTSRIFETETNLLVQCWSAAEESSEDKIHAHAKAISDSASFLLHKAKRCSEYLLSLLSKPKTLKLIINYCV